MSVAKLSRAEYRRAAELEELRKSGAAPLAVDEDGNMINPHIPQFIAAAPWYLQSDRPSTGLKHQRLAGSHQLKLTGNDLSRWYKKGGDTVVNAVSSDDKYVSGACVNCGSLSHVARDCLDRPRAVNARKLGRKLAPDHITQQLNLSYEEKRDRWAGYDTQHYKSIIDKYERLESQRKKLKSERPADPATVSVHHSDTSASEHNSDVDDLKDSGELIQSTDDKTNHTVRNLRLREDTAKYLHNLHVNSAYYDPKSRSMRDNPFSEQNDARAQQFAAEHFVKQSHDDVSQLSAVERFVWESSSASGNAELHAQALPTAVEHMYKQYKTKKKELTQQKHDELAQLYGVDMQAYKMPPELLQPAHTDTTPTHTQDNSADSTAAAAIVRDESIYREDVLTGNHTDIWGSYYELRSHQWGYACCHQLYKGAYCTGAAGRQADIDSQQRTQQQTQHSTSVTEDIT